MEQLTDQIRIKGFLKRLFTQRALLTLKLFDRPEEFISMVIGLDPEQNRFMIDALQPDLGNNLLGQIGKVMIRGTFEGINLSFEANLIETKLENNLPLHVLAIPNVMDYLQRREAIRIKLSAAHPYPVELRTEDKKIPVIHGLIRDLSVGGLGIQVDKKLPAQIESGQHLECTFPLPLDVKQSIRCEVIIRVIKSPIPGQSHSFLGIQFIDMLKPQQRLLEKSIMNLQRLAQQRRNGEEDEMD
ncbi:MAG: flagellar brake protein [Gammaproteobacteria bacterium]|nr:flagellar brake protein [Gammaproteobacteria bacterium]